MPRSASEATRFTATSPHAYSKPVSSSARLSAPQPSQSNPAYSRTGKRVVAASSGGGNGGGAGSAPANETPAEKVARLRAAHMARRAAEISTFDKIVVRGRAIADTAHRVTVAGIVGLSVICVGVVVYSFVDLHRHNNKKKAEWLEHEFNMLRERLVEARRAEVQGRATDDQILLLNRERAKIQAEEEREKSGGVMGAVKGLFGVGNLKTEETKIDDSKFAGETLRDPASGAPDISRPLATTPTENTAKSMAPAAGPVMTAIQEHRRQTERSMEASGSKGGALDQMADQAVNQVKKDAQSWSSWFGYGSK